MPPAAFSWTPKRTRFCEEYLVDLCAADAARRAGYSEKTAKQIGHELLQLPEIQARIQELQGARSGRTQVTADQVLVELWAIASADTNEIVEHRRAACRYCHGLDHQYQRTPAERLRDYAFWLKLTPKEKVGHQLSNPDGTTFDERGAEAYDRRRRPHPDCPECWGEGEGYVHVKDSRALSAAGRRLYAGAKATREGIDARAHDKLGALTLVGKHLGMFKEIVEHHDGTLEDLIKAAAGEDGGADAGHP